MKVISPISDEEVATSPWIRVGGEYIVLEVLAVAGRRIVARILGEDQYSPGLWELEMFTIVDPAIPSNWVAEIADNGSLSLAPARWLVPGFWEEFFDRDPTAVGIYEEELGVILSEAHNE